MEQSQLVDYQAMMERVSTLAKEVRKSEAFPAIVGAAAGGAVALLIVLLIGRRGGGRRAQSSDASAKASRPWSIGEVAQLIGVITSLLKAVQEWQKQQTHK